jgi:hypothetical protein
MKKQTIESAFSSRKAQEKQKEQAVVQLTDAVKAQFVERFGEAKLKEAEQQAGGRKLLFIKVEDSLAILRPPTAEDLGDYLMAIAENGMAKAGVMIVEQLWIDGDIELINDEDKWCAVFLKMNSLLEGKKGEFFRG